MVISETGLNWSKIWKYMLCYSIGFSLLRQILLQFPTSSGIVSVSNFHRHCFSFLLHHILFQFQTSLSIVSVSNFIRYCLSFQLHQVLFQFPTPSGIVSFFNFIRYCFSFQDHFPVLFQLLGSLSITYWSAVIILSNYFTPSIPWRYMLSFDLCVSFLLQTVFELQVFIFTLICRSVAFSAAKCPS